MYMFDANAVIMGIRHPAWPIFAKIESYEDWRQGYDDRCSCKVVGLHAHNEQCTGVFEGRELEV